jgi:ATP-dependent DNA helicase RecG
MNREIQQCLGHHPIEIGICLGQLVTSGCLCKDGHGRGTRYRLDKSDGNSSNQRPVTISVSFEHLLPSSEHLLPSSEHLLPSSEHLSADRKKQEAQS